jgi:hypothetical protein
MKGPTIARQPRRTERIDVIHALSRGEQLHSAEAVADRLGLGGRARCGAASPSPWSVKSRREGLATCPGQFDIEAYTLAGPGRAGAVGYDADGIGGGALATDRGQPPPSTEAVNDPGRIEGRRRRRAARSRQAGVDSRNYPGPRLRAKAAVDHLHSSRRSIVVGKAAHRRDHAFLVCKRPCRRGSPVAPRSFGAGDRISANSVAKAPRCGRDAGKLRQTRTCARRARGKAGSSGEVATSREEDVTNWLERRSVWIRLHTAVWITWFIGCVKDQNRPPRRAREEPVATVRREPPCARRGPGRADDARGALGIDDDDSSLQVVDIDLRAREE